MSVFGVSANRLLSLWPGLPAAWFRGSLGGLLIALGFAVVLQFALLSTTVWPLWLGPIPVPVVWFCVVLYWLAAVIPTFPVGSRGHQDARLRGQRRLDLFRDAQAEYLTGNWFEAEKRLLVLLEGDESDVEARLMLASLYRRLGRFGEALDHLEVAGRFDGIAKWYWEIGQERKRLERLRTADEACGTQSGVDRGMSAHAA